MVPRRSPRSFPNFARSTSPQKLKSLTPAGLAAAGVLIAAALYLGYQRGVPRYTLGPPRPLGQETPAPPRAWTPQAAGPRAVTPAPVPAKRPPAAENASPDEIRQRSTEPTTGRPDPFAPLVLPDSGMGATLPPPPPALPLPGGPSTAVLTPPPPGTGMRVAGIMGGRVRVAIVETDGSSYIVGKGDRIGDAVVTSVLPDRVVLKERGETVALSIGPSGSASIAAIAPPQHDAGPPAASPPAASGVPARTSSPATGAQGGGRSSSTASSNSAGQGGAPPSGTAQGPQTPPTIPTGVSVFTPNFYQGNGGGAGAGAGTTTGSTSSSAASPSQPSPPSGSAAPGTGGPAATPGTSPQVAVESGQASSSDAGQEEATPKPEPHPAPPVTPASRPPGTPPVPRSPASSPQTGRLYQITAGPIYGQRRAEEIARRLATSGSAIGVTMKDLGVRAHYRVVSEPLPPTIAGRRAAALGDLHATQEAGSGGKVRLVYGDFALKRQAAVLVAQIRAHGFSATVEASRVPAYSATVLTPFQKSAVDSSIAIIKLGGDVPVAVQPLQ